MANKKVYLSPNYDATRIKTLNKEKDLPRKIELYNSLTTKDEIVSWLRTKSSESRKNGVEIQTNSWLFYLGKYKPICEHIFAMDDSSAHIITQGPNQYNISEDEYTYKRQISVESIPPKSPLPKELSDKLQELGYTPLN